MHRFVSFLLLLCVMLLALPACSDSLPTPPADVERRITVCNYNVAGLPKLFGNQAEDVAANQAKIGAQLTERAFDIAAVQEDFGYHKHLNAALGEHYTYRTNHTGGVPGGDGLNVYSRYPLYNEERTAWDASFGIIDDGADAMTPKGILYTLIALEDGVYLDFYNIHADAYGDEGSAAAREVQFRQLAAILERREIDRPVIIVGDFNTSVSRENDSGLYENLMAACGLSDMWITLYNGGDTEDFSAHEGTDTKWDSIEKVLYRSGGGITLTPEDFAYEYLTDENGVSLSDHPAAVCSFTYSLAEDFVPTAEKLTVPRKDHLRLAVTKVRYIAYDLFRILSDTETLWNYAKPIIDGFIESIREAFDSGT